MLKHLNIRIAGRVQGVFFRDAARQKAEELGVCGFARNEPDSTVYIEAEGEENDLGDFVKWCKEGPRLAKIDKVEIKESELKNFSNFSVEY